MQRYSRVTTKVLQSYYSTHYRNTTEVPQSYHSTHHRNTTEVLQSYYRRALFDNSSYHFQKIQLDCVCNVRVYVCVFWARIYCCRSSLGHNFYVNQAWRWIGSLWIGSLRISPSGFRDHSQGLSSLRGVPTSHTHALLHFCRTSGY